MYQQIKERLRAQILDGTFKIGDRIPTEAELSEQFNVSRITVRQAILGLVDEGYLYRQSRLGTFVRDYSKVNEDKYPKIIGLLVTTIKYSFFPELIASIEDTARKAGYGVMVCSTDNSAEKIHQYIDSFTRNRIKGVIFTPMASEDYERDNISVIEEFNRRSIEYIMLDGYLGGINSSYVVSDNFKGAYESTKYLLSLGHRRIAFLSNLRCTSVTDRLAGFLKAMNEEHLVVPPDAMAVVKGPDPEKVAYDCTMRILQSAYKPTAFLYINDAAAIGSYRAIVDSGLEVPKDISCISFDEIASLPVPYTIVRQKMKQMGKAAFDLLQAKMRGEEASNVILPTDLIVRESCQKLT